jgi:small subunit ribosomal protein S1
VNGEVLDVDLERERVSLSLKATQEDPWRQFARRHDVGDVIEGRVTKLVPFGAFVEVDDAIEGLVHISELAEHHVEKAEDEVHVHDRVPVKIIDIDLDRRRISLSRKQSMPSAAQTVEGAAAEEMQLERESAEMEVEVREASEDVGVSTVDASQGPHDEAQITDAAEGAPDIVGTEATAPEVAPSAMDAAEAAPPEEADEAAQVSEMTRERPASDKEQVTAADPGVDTLDERVAQEESDTGGPEPGEAVEDVPVPAAEGAEPGPEREEPSDHDDSEESLESIVQDLKRERGQ